MEHDTNDSTIPPGTLLRLVTSDPERTEWTDRIGHLYEVGPYCRDCGLDVLWITDKSDGRVETVGRDDINTAFEIVKLSTTEDYYGDAKKK